MPSAHLTSHVPVSRPSTRARRAPAGLRSRLPQPFLLTLFGLAACGGDAGAGSGAAPMEVVKDTVDGVERVTYGEGGAKALPWALDTTTLIGGYTVEDPDYQFGRLTPAWLASDDAGNLYVFDSDAIRIMGYDAGGTLIGQWGREGGGPGEIGGRFGVGAMDIGPGDTLWIADRPNQRFTLIPVGEEGGEPASMPLTDTDQPMSVGQLHVDGRGPLAEVRSFTFDREAEHMPPRVIVRFARGGAANVGDEGAAGESAAGEGATSEGAASTDGPGAGAASTDGPGAGAASAATGRTPARDTLWAAPPRSMEIMEMSSGGNRFFMLNTETFTPRLHWVAFSDGGIAVNDSAAYVLHLLDADGETQRVIQRSPPPRATTDEDRQAMIDQVLEPPENAENEDEGAADRRRQRAEAMYFADVIPRIVELRVDPKDRIWVGVSEAEPDSISRIDVYERDGTLVGELRDMPMPDYFFGEDGAVVLGRDELDVQQIRILRLVEEEEALETVAAK